MALKRLAEIYKQEKKSGGGLVSASGKRLLEKFDPRQMIDQSGLLATMFPSLKAYRATPEKTPSPRSTSSLSELSSATGTLQDIDVKMDVLAKNSLVWKSMGRDIFLIKENINKLVKAAGDDPMRKAPESYFARRDAEESAYEERMQKEKSKSPTPSGAANSNDATKDEEGKKPLSFMSRLGLGLKSFGKGVIETVSSINPAFVKGATFLGAGIAGFIGAFAGITAITGKLLEVFGLEDSSKNLFRSMAEGFKEFDGIDGTNLLSVAGSITALSGALALFGASKVLDAISNLGTAFLNWVTGGKTDPITQLKRFSEELDADKMSKVGQGTKDLAEGLKILEGVDFKKIENLKNVPLDTLRKLSQTGAPAPAGSTPTPSTPAPTEAKKTPSPTPAGGAKGSAGAAPSPATGTPSAAPGLPIDFKSYADEIAKKESGGNYGAVNTLGYLGKYQFGAMALEDMGLVKKGVGRLGQKALDDPNNWNIEGGKQAFLSNAKLQEETMAKYTQQNYKTLTRIGVINKDSSPEEVAGFLAASHLLGPGGAKQLAMGNAGTDAYGTSSATYYKVGSSSQGNQGTKVASASSKPSSGATVAAASSSMAEGQRASMTPAGGGTTVVDNSQRTTVASASGTKPSSTYDTALVQTLIGIAA